MSQHDDSADDKKPKAMKALHSRIGDRVGGAILGGAGGYLTGMGVDKALGIGPEVGVIPSLGMAGGALMGSTAAGDASLPANLGTLGGGALGFLALHALLNKSKSTPNLHSLALGYGGATGLGGAVGGAIGEHLADKTSADDSDKSDDKPKGRKINHTELQRDRLRSGAGGFGAGVGGMLGAGGGLTAGIMLADKLKSRNFLYPIAGTLLGAVGGGMGGHALGQMSGDALHRSQIRDIQEHPDEYHSSVISKDSSPERAGAMNSIVPGLMGFNLGTGLAYPMFHGTEHLVPAALTMGALGAAGGGYFGYSRGHQAQSERNNFIREQLGLPVKEASDGMPSLTEQARAHAVAAFDRAAQKTRELAVAAKDRIPGLIEAAKELKGRAGGAVGGAVDAVKGHVSAHPYAYGAAGLGAAGLLGRHIYKNLRDAPELTDQDYEDMNFAALQGYQG